MKTIVIAIGAGATGKSTLTRTLCGPDAEEYKTTLACYEHKSDSQVLETVTYVLSPNGLAIAGNLKNGSDSISHMDALRQVVELCWTTRDIVIVDTLRATYKFIDWAHEHPLRPSALFVYLNPSLDTNLARLRGRRAANGIVESEVPTRTFWNVFSFRERARSVWGYAQAHYRREPVRFLEITEATPEESARLVLQELELLKTANSIPGKGFISCGDVA
jgi:hypothetical protein